MQTMSVAAAPRLLETIGFESGDRFTERRRDLALAIQSRRAREAEIAKFDTPISYPGHCGICDRATEFTCSWDIHRTLPDGSIEPVWRERLLCPCGLSNRLRASFHFMLERCHLQRDSSIYLTEALTPFFKMVQGYNPSVTGSEYLRDGTPPGQINAAGIRHEDITALSFADHSFDLLGCFEVLEHVPDYRTALREMARVIKPGGHLVASFPFAPKLQETLVRARVTAEGKIEHLVTPEYHGDPLCAEGVLCFYHFGWDILDDMRAAGFTSARCEFYWDWDSGYLGGALPLFHGVK